MTADAFKSPDSILAFELLNRSPALNVPFNASAACMILPLVKGSPQEMPPTDSKREKAREVVDILEEISVLLVRQSVSQESN